MARKEQKVNLKREYIGCTLARDVMLGDGINVLVGKYARISDYIYKRLIELGVKDVYIWVEESEKEKAEYKQIKLQKSHVEGVKSLEKAFTNTLNSDKVEVAEIAKICEEIKVPNESKSTVFQLMSEIRSADDQTYAHSVNVSILAGLFGTWLGFNEKEIQELMMAGIMHDIGKTLIPDSILKKTTPLTESEVIEMQLHTIRGYELLKKSDLPENVKLTALMHHERIGGSGYPQSLIKADEINYFARIIAIVDIFDASSHERSYRQGVHTPFAIFKMFQEDLFGKLDMDLIEVFMTNVAYMYSGAKCRLSDNRTGEIVFINPTQIQSPMVRIGDEIVDLKIRNDVYVERVDLI